MTAIEEAKEKGKRLTKNEKKRFKEKLKKQNNNNSNEVKTGKHALHMSLDALIHLLVAHSNCKYGIIE